MKHFLNYISLRTYYVFITFIIISLIGVFFYLDFQEYNLLAIFCGIVLGYISITLVIIPKYGWTWMIYSVVLVTHLYLYTLTVACKFNALVFFIFLMAPMVSFIFSNKKYFVFSITLNFILIGISIGFFTIEALQLNVNQLKFPLDKTIQLSLYTQLSLILINYLMQKRLEKLQEFYEELQHLDRLTTLSQITASIVHEIKNPLTTIKGYMQIYLAKKEISEKEKEETLMLLSEVNHIENEIKFLLNMSKPNEKLDVEVINIEDELNHIIGLVKPITAIAQVNVVLDLKEKECLKMSQIEFKQLFLNLIKNAIEASSSNQTVIIQSKKQDKLLQIEVKDDGCGMTKEDLANIGTPFFSKKQLGNGLGMLVCTNIINRYNGKLLIQSEINQGTTVTVQLPYITHY